MIEPFLLFFSNRTELLYERLKNQLFPGFNRPFAARFIIVQNAALQNWLTVKLAKDFGVCTGIEFLFIKQAFHRLLEFSNCRHLHFPHASELSLAIELELRHLKDHFHRTSESQKEVWQSIAGYLIDKPEARILSLSQQLGYVFYEHGRSNKSAPVEVWQNQLWNTIFSKNPAWSWPALEYAHPITINADIELHFFAVNDLNTEECHYLKHLGNHLPVHFYSLSPCMMYWSDSRSDRERASLLSYWQDKEIPSGQLNSLNRLLEDRNPLLANWGKKGRGLAEFLEETISHPYANYRLASSIKEWEEAYNSENLAFDEADTPLSLLQAIQADLLLLRNPESSPIKNIAKQDESLQVHSAPNKRREVEALFHTLMRLFDKKAGFLTPSDVIVLSPQLNEYTSFIQCVFARKESPLTAHFLEDQSLAHQEMIQALLDLIDLSGSRWETPSILQLFSHPAFQRCHKISPQDFTHIKKWIKKSKITWGFDIQHRQQLFKNHHAKEILTIDTSGTWIEGMNRIQRELLPSANIEEQAGFDRFKKIILSLYKILTCLQDGTQQSIEDWMDYLQKMIEANISPRESDPATTESYDFILNQLDSLKVSHRHFKEYQFTFESLWPHLFTLLKQKKKNYHEKPAQAISFGSLTDFKSLPFKVIALLGMDEEAFPNLKAKTFLLGKESHSFSPTDEDRYLFLETLHCARESLLIFFSEQNSKEISDNPVSPVVEELLSYCDRFYSFEGQQPSTHCTFKHPFCAHSPLYFQESSPLRSYSYFDYQKAVLLTQPKKSIPVILKEFPKPEILKENPHSSLSLQELQRAAKNPIKLHLNRRLGIYLDNELKTEEKLQLTPLEKYSIREKSLKKPIELILKEEEFQLPTGLFKNVALQQSQEEADILLAKLAKHQVKPEDLFSIEFSTDSLQPEHKEANWWVFPAPEIIMENKKSVKIIGTIPYVSPQGLILFQKSAPNDIWKNWPTLLLFSYVAQRYPHLTRNQVIFTQAPKTKSFSFEDPLALLADWVAYYHLCLTQFSPLLPDWISYIVNQDEVGLKKQYQKIFSDFSSIHAHRELRWVFHPDHLPCPEKLIQDWSHLAKGLTKSME